MSATYRIAGVSRRSWFSSSALRCSEGAGLVPGAARTEAGYRVHDDGLAARLSVGAGARS